MTHIEALKKTGGNATQAAKLLDVSRKTFYNTMPEEAKPYLQGRTVESPKILRSYSLSPKIVARLEKTADKTKSTRSALLELILSESKRLK